MSQEKFPDFHQATILEQQENKLLILYSVNPKSQNQVSSSINKIGQLQPSSEYWKKLDLLSFTMIE